MYNSCIFILSSAPGLYIITIVGHIKEWNISILDTLGQIINYRGGLISGVEVPLLLHNYVLNSGSWFHMYFILGFGIERFTEIFSF